MLSWPRAGGEWFHPRCILMALVVRTGHPCIPLLSFKRCLGGLICPRGSESLPPRPCPYTPPSSVRVPDGKRCQEIVAAQSPVFTTGCILSHLALAETCGPFPTLPSPHCSCALAGAPMAEAPQCTSPTSVSLPPCCSCPPQLLAHTLACIRNTNLKCNT